MTDYSKIITPFLSMVSKDKSYFNYFHLSEEQALEVANTRALTYMQSAINRIILEGNPTVDFTNRDNSDGRFNFDLTPSELILIPSLMYEAYLEQDIALIKVESVNYTPTELRVFDPSSARSSFMDMYKFICERNDKYLSIYRSSDRNGNYRDFSFALYDET